VTNAWYAHYPGDYTRDTAHLTLKQHGAYRLLLDHYYATSSPLPPGLGTLYRICRALNGTDRKAVDFVVLQFFDLRGDGYHNPRADRELLKRAEHRERLSEGAHKTNVKRWGNDRSVNRLATRSAVARPQPQPEEEKKKISRAPKNAAMKLGSPQFLTFWDSYPRKEGRKAALGIWEHLQLDGRLEEVLAGLEAWKKAREPQYMPYAQGWLNQESWKEIPLKGNADVARETISSREQQRHERNEQALKNVFGRHSDVAETLRDGLSRGAERGADSGLRRIPERASSGTAPPSVSASNEEKQVSPDASRSARIV
jgi:uncharacterized protein YdaU (DUF1376 family)